MEIRKYFELHNNEITTYKIGGIQFKKSQKYIALYAYIRKGKQKLKSYYLYCVFPPAHCGKFGNAKKKKNSDKQNSPITHC